jgi:2-haloacid dehalogenase
MPAPPQTPQVLQAARARHGQEVLRSPRAARLAPSIALEILQSVAAAGGKNIIATNNDPLRTLFIENAMELGARVARIFSSGRMGCLKPEAEFFRRVTDELGVSADHVILVDDNLPNLRAARDLGWQTHHFSGDHASLKARLGLG